MSRPAPTAADTSNVYRTIVACLVVAAGCRAAGQPAGARPEPSREMARVTGARYGGLAEIERETTLSGKPPVRVEGKVRDASSHRALAARVLVEDGGGTEPGAALAGLGFWCPGTFTVRALSGRLSVKICAGRRRVAFARDWYTRPGERIRLRAELPSPSELRFEERGWFGADLFRPLDLPQGRDGTSGALRERASLELLALATRAEGVSFCGVAPPWGGLSAEEVARKCEELSSAGVVLAPVARTADAPFYGGAFFLGGADPASSRDASFSASSTAPVTRAARSFDIRRPNFLAFEDCRAGDGTSIVLGVADTREIDPRSELAALEPGLAEYYKGAGVALDGAAWELPFDLIGGSPPDALALSGSAAEEAVWFRLLCMGYRLPGLLVERRSFAEGAIPTERTLVRLASAEKPSARSVAEAIRAGRVVATEGPYVFLTINGFEPGSVLRADGSPRTVRFEAYSSTETDNTLTALELVRNGQVVESVPGEGRTSIVASLSIREKESSWYIARARAGLKKERRAWTSPVYFESPGRSPPRVAMTIVRGKVADSISGKPLAAKVEARLGGRTVASTATDPATGAYSIAAPPASLLEVSSEGYAPARESIFFHTRAPEEIRAMHTNSTGRGGAVLAEERTYELMRLACAEAEIDLRLERLHAAR